MYQLHGIATITLFKISLSAQLVPLLTVHEGIPNKNSLGRQKTNKYKVTWGDTSTSGSQLGVIEGGVPLRGVPQKCVRGLASGATARSGHVLRMFMYSTVETS